MITDECQVGFRYIIQVELINKHDPQREDKSYSLTVFTVDTEIDGTGQNIDGMAIFK